MLRSVDGLEGEHFAFGEAQASANAVPTSVAIQTGADGPSVTIPDAHLLFNAQFSRAGADLVLQGDSGQAYVVHDYFAGDARVPLLSPEGAMLSADVVAALAGPLAPGQYAQAGAPAAAAQAVGRVAQASSDATIVRNGVAVPAQAGDPILKGDVMQTVSGTLGVTFNDGSTLNLTANTRMVVNEFVYDPQGAQNSQLLNLVQGSLTFISGEIAHTGNMSIATPVATMGIRGTVGGVTTASDGTVNFYVSQSATGAVILDSRGVIIANVVQDGPMIIVRPVGPLQVLAEEVQKTPAQLAVELAALQQILSIKAIGDQILQQNQQPDPNANPNPNPQSTDKPLTQIQLFPEQQKTGQDGAPNASGDPPNYVQASVTTTTTNPDGSQTKHTDVVPIPPHVNVAPILNFFRFAVEEGGSKVLSVSDFSITDPDSSSFAFGVSNVTGGTFQVLKPGPAPNMTFSAFALSDEGEENGHWVNADGFTAADIAAGHVRFVHDGSNAAPAFSIWVSDGNGGTSTSISPTVTYTEVDNPPELFVWIADETGAKVAENGELVFGLEGPQSIYVSDSDSATLTVRLTATNGTVALDPDSIVDVTITGQGTASLTLTGSPQAVNAALNGMKFKPDEGYAGPAELTIRISDDLSTTAQTVEIMVEHVNDPPVLILSHSETVADQFASRSYDLNSGTVNWATGWIENENGDYPSNPATGEIQVKIDPSGSGNFRLFLSDDDAEAGAADTIQRTADLSGATNATLTFDYRRDIQSGDPSDVVYVWASSDGLSFTRVGQIGATGYGRFVDSDYQQFSLDISAYISPSTTIRFSVDDSVDNNDWFYIDNVKIDYSVLPTFVEGGPAVSIASLGTRITDSDGTHLQSATIKIANYRAGDLLAVSGMLPFGIAASAYNALTGVLTLTGSATLADYATALHQVQFSNTGDDPGGADRTIQITVSDGIANSNVGTVTVHVTPVNDGPAPAIVWAVPTDPDNIAFSVVSANNAVATVNWGDSETSQSGTSFSHSYGSADDSTLKVSVGSGTVAEYAVFSNAGQENMFSFVTGSANADVLIGNAAALYNIYNGDAGNDVMFATASHDTFVFKEGGGHDIVVGFNVSADVIDATDFGLFTDHAIEVFLAEAVSTPQGTLLVHGDDSLFLQGVDIHAITAANFHSFAV